jgi:signal transduction histidine kinase/CheY-like chemotaxis protein
LSLLSQKKAEGSLKIYIYIITGGVGSLLAFFLLQRSLPINKQQAKEYYQAVQIAEQAILELDKELIKFQYSHVQPNNSLNLQLTNTKKAISNLQSIPSFYSQAEANILNSKLETQIELLSSQSKLIEQQQVANAKLEQACVNITQLKDELIANPKLLSSYLLANNELNSLTNEVLNITVTYCHDTDDDLALSIESKIKQLDVSLKQNKSIQDQFIIAKLIDYGKAIIQQKQEINDLFKQISLSDLQIQLESLESGYLEQYQSSIARINKYRLLSSLLFLLVVFFVIYKIINNLATTNRSIVKVLENFTQELESKVEQRTAQLEASIQNTEAALAQAQNANKAKSRFLANMSHELRTPLNAILGFTQLMCRDTSMEQEHQENLKIINRSGEHLLKLINDILEMSKIEVGQITFNETRFDLHTMLKSLEEMLQLKAKAKNLALIFQIANNVPRFIKTDEGKLRQIIINLLGNALKFTSQGSINLTVKLEENNKLVKDKIDFLFSDTYSLYFAVEDTGPGIEAEEMEQLFSPFEQTKIGRISNEGTGLGLSICQKFVELMGGELKVQSTVGQGSIFAFNILIKIKDTEIIETIEQIPQENKKVICLAPNQPKYRILAVDDVAPSRLLLKKLLSEIGFEVQEAGNGLETVQLWQEWHPDLILMDMRMPVMDGYEATKQIKSQPQGEKTIIIALTASAFEEERVEILAAGCDDFMRKPFYETELLEKIGQHLNVNYLYQEQVESSTTAQLSLAELTPENLTVMSLEWRSQLYEAAAKVDNQEILQLLAEIPQEYEALAKGLENLVEQFRCDKIIDLTKSVK